MPRMQVYLPDDLYDEVKSRKLPASELLQEAVRAELERQRALEETDAYLAELDAELGPPAAEEQARAELLAKGADRSAWTATKDPASRGADGDVVWSAQEQRGYMRMHGLAKNDPTAYQYQLWIFDADRDDKFPVDGGVFDVKGDEVVVPVTARLPVGKAVLFAVTIEKPGGVVVSKRERIVLTAKPAAG